MNVPKHYKLDKAAAAKPRPETGLHLDCVHVLGDRLLASNGDGAAVVRILDPAEEPALTGAVRLEPGEERQEAVLPLQAVREATKGKTGLGTLRIGERSTEAQAASGKAWMRVDNPEPAGQIPNFDHALELTERPAPETHRYVEVNLDAQLLAGLAAAIGAEEGVRLRFLVDKESGIADAGGDAHGAVDVRPIRDHGVARAVLMIHVVSGT